MSAGLIAVLVIEIALIAFELWADFAGTLIFFAYAAVAFAALWAVTR